MVMGANFDGIILDRTREVALDVGIPNDKIDSFKSQDYTNATAILNDKFRYPVVRVQIGSEGSYRGAYAFSSVIVRVAEDYQDGYFSNYGESLKVVTKDNKEIKFL